MAALLPSRPGGNIDFYEFIVADTKIHPSFIQIIYCYHHSILNIFLIIYATSFQAEKRGIISPLSLYCHSSSIPASAVFCDLHLIKKLDHTPFCSLPQKRNILLLAEYSSTSAKQFISAFYRSPFLVRFLIVRYNPAYSASARLFRGMQMRLSVKEISTTFFFEKKSRIPKMIQMTIVP